MTLKDQGFRFCHMGGGEYSWIHPLDGQPFAKDCTEMTDDEFEAYVLTNSRPPSP